MFVPCTAFSQFLSLCGVSFSCSPLCCDVLSEPLSCEPFSLHSSLCDYAFDPLSSVVGLPPLCSQKFTSLLLSFFLSCCTSMLHFQQTCPSPSATVCPFAHSPSRAPRSSTSVLSLQTVWNDLRLDVFPRFLKDPLYTKYIRTKWFETLDVTPEDFTTFRVLGRGAFGSVSPIGALY